MKFMVDAQLPVALSQALCAAGHDAVHTSELPLGNSTTDSEIIELCVLENRVVITKDADFADLFVRRRKPEKLVVVATGNVSNRRLREIFREHLADIVSLLDQHSYIEIDRTRVLVHG